MSEKVKLFFSRFGSSYKNNSQTLPQLNTDNLKAKLRLKQEATERAEADLPPTNLSIFDDVEQKVISFINDEVNSATESYYDHLRSFEERINRLPAAGNVGSIESVAIKAEGDFEGLVRRDASNLHIARVAVTESETDLENFKNDNNLKRSARYPDSRFLYVSVALLLVTIETGLNGFFFAQGHELGLLGGGFTALVPSLLNVCAGYYIGNFAFRLAVNKNKLKKFSGILFCIFLPFLILCMNLLVAHYRSAMTNLTEEGSVIAAKMALTSFSTIPFNLQDVESWLLFAMGSLFCVIATIDFWKMDDSYLHFGEITRDHKRKLYDYADMKAHSLEELSSL